MTPTAAQLARYRHLAGIPDVDEIEILDPPVLYSLLTARDVEVLERRRQQRAEQQRTQGRPRLRIVA